MIQPQRRASIYDVLRPPTGSTLDALIACTYSAALDTVLSLPGAMLADTVGRTASAESRFTAAELASLKRVCARTLVFCQAGAIHPAAMLPPAVIEVERMVHEVKAPVRGAFHPKVWLIRFISEESRPLLRVAVMSRNLTADPSWDLALVADGAPSGSAQRDAELPRFLRALPKRCLRPLSANRLALLEEMAGEAARVRWKGPAGVGPIRFHALGLEAEDQWDQPKSDQLAILSPFLTSKTVKRLALTSARPVVLLSRADALERCWPAAEAGFERTMVLSPPADGDGEAASLHAKALFWQRGTKVRAALGSMNATCAATTGRNVEFMASFDCTAAFGDQGLDGLLGTQLLGTVIEDYAPDENNEPPVPQFDDRPARYLLAAAALELRCKREANGWDVALTPLKPVGAELLDLLPGLQYRLATMAADTGIACGSALAVGDAVPLPMRLELAEITGFVVFHAAGEAGTTSFTLNLRVVGVDDEERRIAALRATIPDPTHFDEFVRVMLGDFSGLANMTQGNGQGSMSPGWESGQKGGLLELLIRCAVDEPARFASLRQAIDALGEDQLARLAPGGFEKTWTSFLEAATNIP